MLMPRRHWMDMTTEDIKQADTGSWIAVLPVAAIEQHGPHLPLGTDHYIMQGYLDEAMQYIPVQLPITFLPVQSIGVSIEHDHFAGTLSLPMEAALASWLAIGKSLAAAGIRKLVIANSHGGNAPVMDGIARKLRKKYGMLVVMASFSRLGYPESLFSEDEMKYGIHGGQIETSLMLHLCPDRVRMERAENFIPRSTVMAREYVQLRATSPVGFGWMSEDLHQQGAMGDALSATADAGQQALAFGAKAFVTLLHDVQNFNL